MGLSKPFYRTARQLADGSYQNSGNGRYIKHPLYAPDADKYIRAYMLIQKDMVSIFDYVHSSDANLTTYSFRIHEIIIRTCIEIEANFKAILRSNGYKTKNNYNISDFFKVEATHRLSGYTVQLPYWDGTQSLRHPFKSFLAPPSGTSPSPSWYQSYNATKHDRHQNFQRANLETMIDAVSGLAVLIAAQFLNEDFAPVSGTLSFTTGDEDGSEDAIGGVFSAFLPD